MSLPVCDFVCLYGCSLLVIALWCFACLVCWVLLLLICVFVRMVGW